MSNKGDGVARDTVIVDTISEGMSFIDATHNGRFENGQVVWNLGTLLPDTSERVSMNVRADNIGMQRNLAKVTAYCNEATAETMTDVVGIAAILLEVIDLEDPIEVGANVTYLINVTNQGSAVGTNIEINCILPDGMDYVTSSGPTMANVRGQNVSFVPLGTLQPQDTATYRVIVRGVLEGDLRFKVQLDSDQITSPVNETESTNVYK